MRLVNCDKRIVMIKMERIKIIIIIELNCYSVTKTNSVAFSPQANYTDRATAACWRS
jgi:hypothetical protein